LLLVLLFCPAWGLSMLLYMGSYPLSWAGLCWGECSPTHTFCVYYGLFKGACSLCCCL
jgi:hypothetical protein